MNSFKPPGWPTVIPRIFTHDVAGLVGFLHAVFAAEGEERAGAPTEIRIGDSMIMVSDGRSQRHTHPAFLYVYVPDADQAYHEAIEQSAVTIEPPADTPYGDRRAMVRDR
jgi:PhnB protein